MDKKVNYCVRIHRETSIGGTAVRTYPADNYLAACRMYEAMRDTPNVRSVALLRQGYDGSLYVMRREER